MADYHEQQRREQQRRWEESQRQQRQWEAQQRRDQEHRQQERQRSEQLARQRHATELEEERRRHNERLREQREHAERMRLMHEEEKKVREKANHPVGNRSNSISPTVHNWPDLSSHQPSADQTPTERPGTASDEPSTYRPSKDDVFAKIDSLLFQLLKRVGIPLLVIGAIAGAAMGWQSHPLWNHNDPLDSVIGYALLGIVFTVLAIALLRWAAKALAVLIPLAVICGLAWLCYRLLQLLFGHT